MIRPDILTCNGNYFNFINPELSDFGIEEIAHGLSHICRFGGQTREFYSVAQHSVYVSKLVSPKHAMEGLLHDSSEAFLGDVVKPLKELLADYKQIEKRVERAIFSRFKLLYPLPNEVKLADLIMLATEQRDLMPYHSDEWFLIKNIEPLEEIIQPLNPKEAKELFLKRYNELL